MGENGKTGRNLIYLHKCAAYVYACAYVHEYVFVYVYEYVREYVYEYVCVHVCVYVMLDGPPLQVANRGK